MWALCRQTLDVYEDGKVALSESLLDRARRRAKLSADETRALLVETGLAGHLQQWRRMGGARLLRRGRRAGAPWKPRRGSSDSRSVNGACLAIAGKRLKNS